MRRRRALRCLLRAEVAIQAGFLDDARTAIEEARRLDAPAEEIARIQGLLDASAAEPRIGEGRLGWKRIAVGAAIALAAWLSGFGAFWRDAPAALRTAQSAVAEPTAPAADDAVQKVPVRVDEVLAVPTTGVLPEGTIANASEPSSRGDAEPEPSADPPTEATAPTPGVETPEPAPPPRTVVSQPQALTTAPGLPLPRPAISPSAPSVAPASAEALSRDAPMVAARITPSVDPVPTLAAAAPPRDESADVRAVLARYESAFSRLDPSGARAVWPGVDERALARAFNSLASQRFSLGRCELALSGPIARATCVGTATWTPKVGGGGARTEARRWTFDLRKSGDSWTIERALVR